MLIHTPSSRGLIRPALRLVALPSELAVRTGMRTGMAHPGRARTGQNGPGGPCMDRTAAGFQTACGTYPGPECRRYYLPFASDGAVAAGATATITADPQIDMVPDELVVPSTISPFFDIVSIVIGRTPQAAAPGPVSAEVFSSAAFRSHTLMDPVARGTTVSLVVTNTDMVGRVFRAALFGAGNAFN